MEFDSISQLPQNLSTSMITALNKVFAAMAPMQPVIPTEPVKEAVEEVPKNNLELSDKPLSDDAMASLSVVFSDDEKDQISICFEKCTMYLLFIRLHDKIKI